MSLYFACSQQIKAISKFIRAAMKKLLMTLMIRKVNEKFFYCPSTFMRRQLKQARRPLPQ